MIRGYYDNKGKFKGFSNDFEWIGKLIMGNILIGTIVGILCYPYIVYQAYKNAKEDEEFEKTLSEEELYELKQKELWYPWHRYQFPYIMGLLCWIYAAIRTIIEL